MGVCTVYRFKKEAARKRGVVFLREGDDIPNAFYDQSPNKIQYCSTEYLARTTRFFGSTTSSMENPGGMEKHCNLGPK